MRALEARDGVIPVVGDLSGPHAVTAVGQLMAQRGQKLAAFYVSNVENYLFRNGAYARYIENLKRLPHSDRSVLIRSIFGGYSLPESAPGLLQHVDGAEPQRAARQLRRRQVPLILRAAPKISSESSKLKVEKEVLKVKKS